MKFTVIRKNANKNKGIDYNLLKKKEVYTDNEYLMNRGKLLYEFFNACNLRVDEK